MICSLTGNTAKFLILFGAVLPGDADGCLTSLEVLNGTGDPNSRRHKRFQGSSNQWCAQQAVSWSPVSAGPARGISKGFLGCFWLGLGFKKIQAGKAFVLLVSPPSVWGGKTVQGRRQRACPHPTSPAVADLFVPKRTQRDVRNKIFHERSIRCVGRSHRRPESEPMMVLVWGKGFSVPAAEVWPSLGKAARFGFLLPQLLCGTET